MENSCVNVEIGIYPFGSQYNCRGILRLYGFDDFLWGTIPMENLNRLFIYIYIYIYIYA